MNKEKKTIHCQVCREGDDLVLSFYDLSRKKVRELGYGFVVKGACHSAHHWAFSENVLRLQDFDFYTYPSGEVLRDFLCELCELYAPDEDFEFGGELING